MIPRGTSPTTLWRQRKADQLHHLEKAVLGASMTLDALQCTVLSLTLNVSVSYMMEDRDTGMQEGELCSLLFSQLLSELMVMIAANNSQTKLEDHIDQLK